REVALVHVVPAEGEVGVDEGEPAHRIELDRLGCHSYQSHSLHGDAGGIEAGSQVVARVIAGGEGLRVERCCDHGGDCCECQRAHRGGHPALDKLDHHGSPWRSASIWCIRSISADCTISTSFANTFTSTSCAAPGEAIRSATMPIAPSWCLIINSRKRRSKLRPFAPASCCISSAVSIPGIVTVRYDAVSGIAWPWSTNQPCINWISDSCDWSILRAIRSSRASAPRVSARRDISIACA